MSAVIEWGRLIIEAAVCMTAGALLMYLRGIQRLNSAAASALRCRNAVLAEQRQRHERVLDQLARDWDGSMNVLASEVLRLSTDNDALRARLAHTTGAVNAWVPKTERGQA